MVVTGMVTSKDCHVHQSSEPSVVAGSKANQWWSIKKGRGIGSKEHREIILELCLITSKEGNGSC